MLIEKSYFLILLLPISQALSKRLYVKHGDLTLPNDFNWASEIQRIETKRYFQCLASCNKDIQCAFVLFKKKLKRCILFNKTSADIIVVPKLVASSADDVYEKVTYQTDFGKSFLLFREKVSWTVAIDTCRKFNTRLIEIKSTHDLDFAKKIYNLNSVVFWVGARSASVWNDFRWLSDNSTVDQSFWAPNQPDGNDYSNIGCANFGFKDLIADQSCTNYHTFLCIKN